MDWMEKNMELFVSTLDNTEVRRDRTVSKTTVPSLSFSVNKSITWDNLETGMYKWSDHKGKITKKNENLINFYFLERENDKEYKWFFLQILFFIDDRLLLCFAQMLLFHINFVYFYTLHWFYYLQVLISSEFSTNKDSSAYVCVCICVFTQYTHTHMYIHTHTQYIHIKKTIKMSIR